jgi:hypothetical protein
VQSQPPITCSQQHSHTHPPTPTGTSFVCDKDGKPVKSASIFSRGLPAWIQHTLGHTFLAGGRAGGLAGGGLGLHGVCAAAWAVDCLLTQNTTQLTSTHAPTGDDPHLHNGSKNLARNGWDYAQSYYPVAQDQAVGPLGGWGADGRRSTGLSASDCVNHSAAHLSGQPSPQIQRSQY